MSLSEEDLTLAHRLVDGTKKAWANAQALYGEATVLANNEAWARALFLHQISLEECAKIEVLCAAISSLLLGHRVQLQGIRRALGRHEAKNKINAYFLPPSRAEEDANAAGDIDSALTAFRSLQDDFHKDSNGQKNSALYVDLSEEGFSSPLEIVDESKFQVARERNGTFMSIAFNKVEMIVRWSGDFEQAIVEMRSAFNSIGLPELEGSNPADLSRALETLRDALLKLPRQQ